MQIKYTVRRHTFVIYFLHSSYLKKDFWTEETKQNMSWNATNIMEFCALVSFPHLFCMALNK